MLVAVGEWAMTGTCAADTSSVGIVGGVTWRFHGVCEAQMLVMLVGVVGK